MLTIFGCDEISEHEGYIMNVLKLCNVLNKISFMYSAYKKTAQCRDINNIMLDAIMFVKSHLSYTEVGLKAANCVEGNIKISYDLGELELGKLDEEYFDDPDLVDILQTTELDTEKMRRFENEELRLIYSVIYSERFQLKGKRHCEVSIKSH